MSFELFSLFYDSHGSILELFDRQPPGGRISSRWEQTAGHPAYPKE
jgi:hypothetical protein